MEISDNMKKILSQTKVKELQEDYVILSFQNEKLSSLMNAIEYPSPFFSYTLTDDEVSIIMKLSDWMKLRRSFSGYREAYPYRVITFDIVLDLSVVGFMSVVSTSLAEAGVSVYPVSTFLKDHILMKKEDVCKAMVILNGLLGSCQYY